VDSKRRLSIFSEAARRALEPSTLERIDNEIARLAAERASERQNERVKTLMENTK